VALNATLLPLINPFNLHYSTYYTPEQPAGRAYPGGNGESILLLEVFFVDVLGVVNEIIIKLTRDADRIRINLYLPKLFQ